MGDEEIEEKLEKLFASKFCPIIGQEKCEEYSERIKSGEMSLMELKQELERNYGYVKVQEAINSTIAEINKEKAQEKWYDNYKAAMSGDGE